MTKLSYIYKMKFTFILLTIVVIFKKIVMHINFYFFDMFEFVPDLQCSTVKESILLTNKHEIQHACLCTDNNQY